VTIRVEVSKRCNYLVSDASNGMMNASKLNMLRTKIEDLKKQWPAHSVSPAMLRELEDLEEELEKELLNAEEGQKSDA